MKSKEFFPVIKWSNENKNIAKHKIAIFNAAGINLTEDMFILPCINRSKVNDYELLLFVRSLKEELLDGVVNIYQSRKNKNLYFLLKDNGNKYYILIKNNCSLKDRILTLLFRLKQFLE